MSFLMWKAQERMTRAYWMRSYGHSASKTYALPNYLVAGLRTEDRFRRDYRDVVRATGPEVTEWAVARAEAASAGRVTVLGFGEIDFGQPMNWNLDAVHGVSWPAGPGLAMRLVPDDQHGDIKVPWELNRLQFLTSVAQAWRLTSDDTFRRQWSDTLGSWAVANPQGMGVAWSCAMEVAIRGMNLLAGGAMMWPVLSIEDRSLLLRLLASHLEFLQRHPERSDISGNHYLVDVGVTLQLALVCHQDPTNRAVRVASRNFFDAVREQFTADGLHFEFATNYHRYMTELVLLTLAECIRWNLPIPADIATTMSRSVAACELLAGSAGQLPLIGDCDSGQLVLFDSSDPNAVGMVLGLGAAVLGGRDAVANLAAGWALARRPVAELTPGDAQPGVMATTLDGFGILQTGRVQVVVRAGDPGLGGRGGHDHSDLTAPVVTLDGQIVVTDPGTWNYTYSREARKEEISAAAHNMVVVDGVDPCPPVEGSVMMTVSTSTRGWVSAATSDDEVKLRCGHSGFSALPGIDRYERQIRVARIGDRVSVSDQVDGSGAHSIGLAWHFAPHLRLAARAEGCCVEVIDKRTNGLVTQVLLGPGWETVEVESSWVAPKYGERIEGQVLRLSQTASLPTTLTTVFTNDERCTNHDL